MAVANIDTFENDITQEIKTKEASLTDIASAGGDIGNAPESGSSKLLLSIGILSFLVAVGMLGWYYYVNITTEDQIAEQSLQTEEGNIRAKLMAISPLLDAGIGDKVTKVTSTEYGHTLSLSEYTSVFAYMIRNESIFADELAASVGSARDLSTSTLAFWFSDMTASNQNMRVGVSDDKTVAYAFLNSKTLLIASSTEGILMLRATALTQ